MQAVLHSPVGQTDRWVTACSTGGLQTLSPFPSHDQPGLVPEMPLLPGDGVEDGGDNEEAGQAKAIDPG